MVVRNDDVVRFFHRRRTHDAPVVRLARVERDVDLAHSRIEAGEYARRPALAPGILRQREQRWHRHNGQIRAERDAVEIGEPPSGFRQHGVDRGNDPLRIGVSGTLEMRVPCRAVAGGNGEPFGGRVEREDSHGAILPVGTEPARAT